MCRRDRSHLGETTRRPNRFGDRIVGRVRSSGPLRLDPTGWHLDERRYLDVPIGRGGFAEALGVGGIESLRKEWELLKAKLGVGYMNSKM